MFCFVLFFKLPKLLLLTKTIIFKIIILILKSVLLLYKCHGRNVIGNCELLKHLCGPKFKGKGRLWKVYETVDPLISKRGKLIFSIIILKVMTHFCVQEHAKRGEDDAYHDRLYSSIPLYTNHKQSYNNCNRPQSLTLLCHVVGFILSSF